MPFGWWSCRSEVFEAVLLVLCRLGTGGCTFSVRGCRPGGVGVLRRQVVYAARLEPAGVSCPRPSRQGAVDATVPRRLLDGAAPRGFTFGVQPPPLPLRQRLDCRPADVPV